MAGFRAANPACNACHARFDPLGLTTERYDTIGRYDATIDESAVLTGVGEELDGPISGLVELAQRLQAGRRVSDCAARNLGTFALGRDLASDDSCALVAVKDKFAETGAFADFYRALSTSPAFVTRDVE